MNLGINAGFAMKNGGKLTFETNISYLDENYLKTIPGDFFAGYYVHISVSDEGEGIPLKYQSKVFEPFFTTKEGNQGSGLGLASVYGIIKDHKGIINFYSEENTGTVFHIYLPVVDSCSCEAEEKSKNYEILETSGTVLLVDDEEIDVVVLDMIMPEMNGKECFYAIREFNPHAKIILSSGYSKEEDFIELSKKGLDGFIKKPFYISELAKTVNGLISKSFDK
jgi:CheY-like chemotaxis protein